MPGGLHKGLGHGEGTWSWGCSSWVLCNAESGCELGSKPGLWLFAMRLQILKLKRTEYKEVLPSCLLVFCSPPFSALLGCRRAELLRGSGKNRAGGEEGSQSAMNFMNFVFGAKCVTKREKCELIQLEELGSEMQFSLFQAFTMWSVSVKHYLLNRDICSNIKPYYLKGMLKFDLQNKGNSKLRLKCTTWPLHPRNTRR